MNTNFATPPRPATGVSRALRARETPVAGRGGVATQTAFAHIFRTPPRSACFPWLSREEPKESTFSTQNRLCPRPLLPPTVLSCPSSLRAALKITKDLMSLLIDHRTLERTRVNAQKGKTPPRLV